MIEIVLVLFQSNSTSIVSIIHTFQIVLKYSKKDISETLYGFFGKNLAKIWQNLAKFGKIWQNLAKFWQKFEKARKNPGFFKFHLKKPEKTRQ